MFIATKVKEITEASASVGLLLATAVPASLKLATYLKCFFLQQYYKPVSKQVVTKWKLVSLKESPKKYKLNIEL